jgi:histidine triad (HIT) family protein
MAYDHTNVFARILRGELPCNKVYEDDMSSPFATSTRRRRCTSS